MVDVCDWYVFLFVCCLFFIVYCVFRLLSMFCLFRLFIRIIFLCVSVWLVLCVFFYIRSITSISVLPVDYVSKNALGLLVVCCVCICTCSVFVSVSVVWGVAWCYVFSFYCFFFLMFGELRVFTYFS